MLDNYINNFETIGTSILFICFVSIILILVVCLIVSLCLLILGCLIKSQKIKGRYLKVVPSITVMLIIIIILPVIYKMFF